MSARLQQSAIRYAASLHARPTCSARAASKACPASSRSQSRCQRRSLHQASVLRAVPPPPASPRAANPEVSQTIDKLRQFMVKTNGGLQAAKSAQSAPIQDLNNGFSDAPLPTPDSAASTATDPSQPVDWTRSYHGLSATPFSPEAAEILQAPIDPEDVEIKPDGILYLPEIKYRRILNKAFGPGGWGLAPRGESIVTGKAVTREYALVVLGRLVSIARGEQDYFSPEGIPTAAEGCRSNALLRCCKDLGIASELWDPRFIRRFMKEHIKEVWAEHVTTKKRKKLSIRKDGVVAYPWKEVKA